MTTLETNLPPSMPNSSKTPPSTGARRPKSGRKKKRGGEVIHVAFGPGGGRIQHADAPKANGARVPGSIPAPPPESQRTSEPVTDVFSPREVAKLLGLSPAKLRSLEKAEIVAPSATRNGRKAYTFQDLIALRATHDLLASHVRVKDVATAIGALRRALPRVTRPLQELRIVSDGRRVVVQAEDGTFEPISGQMVMDFRVEGLRSDVVRLLRPDTPRARARGHWKRYLELEPTGTWADIARDHL